MNAPAAANVHAERIKRTADAMAAAAMRQCDPWQHSDNFFTNLLHRSAAPNQG